MESFEMIYDVTRRIGKWFAILAGVCLFVLMCLNFLDVVGTKFLSKSIPGTLDISEELMVFLTLLPLAYIAMERGHIRITLVEDRLPLTVRRILNAIQYLVAMLITAFVTWRTFVQLKKTIEFMQLKKGMDLPIWPANLVVVISFGFLTFIWILLFIRCFMRSEKG